MAYETILYSVEDGVATLTLNRPEVQNGFNIPVCDEIMAAIEEAKQDASVKFLVINANGKVFSVGGDLDQMQKAVALDDVQSLVRIAEQVNEISFALKKLPKPVIMVVDGPCAGAAANLAVAADFTIASDKAKFIQAFVGVGLAPDAGGLYLLTRSIGINRATQITMTGEPVSAEKALAWGIAYKVVELKKWSGNLNLQDGKITLSWNLICKNLLPSLRTSKKGYVLTVSVVDLNSKGNNHIF